MTVLSRELENEMSYKRWDAGFIEPSLLGLLPLPLLG